MIDHALPVERQDLNKQKVKDRAINIRESGSYILFDIERHPGYGNHQTGQPDIVLQTWRYHTENSSLEMICKFSRFHMDKLAQNDVGEPECRHCNSPLDRHEDLFGFIWICRECGAVGGKEDEIFDPVVGESLFERKDYQEIKDGLYIPDN